MIGIIIFISPLLGNLVLSLSEKLPESLNILSVDAKGPS